MRRLLFADNTLFLTRLNTLCVLIQCGYNIPKPNKYTASWYNVDTKRACVLDMQIATLDRQVGRGASCILRRTLVGGKLIQKHLLQFLKHMVDFFNFVCSHLHFCFPFLLVIFHKCWISSVAMQIIVSNVLFFTQNCWIEIVLFQHKLRFWAAQLRGTYSELWWVSTSIQSVFQWSLLMFINTVSWFTSYTIAIFFNLIDVTLNKTKFISSLWKCPVILFWILSFPPGMGHL